MSVQRIISIVLILSAFAAMMSCSGDDPKSAATVKIAPPTVDPNPVNSLIIDSVSIVSNDPDNRLIQAYIRGSLQDGCTYVESIVQNREENAIKVSIETSRFSQESCSEEPALFEKVLDINTDAMATGEYSISVQGISTAFLVENETEPEVGQAVVGGRIWQDYCDPTSVVAAGQDPVSKCQSSSAGAMTANGIIDDDERGLGGIIVNLGEGDCPSEGLASTVTDTDGIFLFGGLNDGRYCLTIDLNIAANAAILRNGGWSSLNHSSESIHTTIDLAAGESLFDNNYGWEYEQDFDPEVLVATLPASQDVIQATATAVGENATPDLSDPIESTTPTPRPCSDYVGFVADVNVIDNTAFLPGEVFTKTWRLQNNGTCAWDASYKLVFFGGDKMSGEDSAALVGNIGPGDITDISIELAAPEEAGIYRGEWMLQNPTGETFGLGGSTGLPFWVQIVVLE